MSSLLIECADHDTDWLHSQLHDRLVNHHILPPRRLHPLRTRLSHTHVPGLAVLRAPPFRQFTPAFVLCPPPHDADCGRWLAQYPVWVSAMTLAACLVIQTLTFPSCSFSSFL